MTTNKQEIEEHVESERIHNIYTVSIPKTNLKTHTNARHNDIPQNSQYTSQRNDISQYNRLKEMIKNINFKKIVTGIKEKGKSLQDEEIDHSQYPDQQNKLVQHDPQDKKVKKDI